MLNLHVAYLFGDLILGLFWFGIFLLRRDLQKKMLTISLLIGITCIPAELYFRSDYWHPLYILPGIVGIEDLLYGFFFGGIASSIYDVFLAGKYIKTIERQKYWRVATFFFISLSACCYNILFFAFRMGSIYASYITEIVFVIFMCLYRKDLLIRSLTSGILLGIITFVVYVLFLLAYPHIIQEWWDVSRLSKIFVFNVPIEEYISAFGMGIVIGPLYEFMNGIRLRKTE